MRDEGGDRNAEALHTSRALPPGARWNLRYGVRTLKKIDELLPNVLADMGKTSGDVDAMVAGFRAAERAEGRIDDEPGRPAGS